MFRIKVIAKFPKNRPLSHILGLIQKLFTPVKLTVSAFAHSSEFDLLQMNLFSH